MLCLLKSETTLGRLETSGRLFRRRFHGPIFAVAAHDEGAQLRYVRAADVARAGYASAAQAWTFIDANMTQQAGKLDLFGLAPFWFVGCEGWPPSAFLAWRGLHDWVCQALHSDRPLIAASFSADQLLVGFADSAEFHDRLGHAREAPVAQPLLPLPFLLSPDAAPRAIARIEVHLGDRALLYPEGQGAQGLALPLQ